jgi:probable F420-dependent oxidoreductase
MSKIELGEYGIWKRATDTTPELARDTEELGFGSLWVGGSPSGDLGVVEDAIVATDSIGVATGIVNMWRDDAATVAASFHRIEERHPGRFLLGVGIGHPEATSEYRKPYETMVTYLDELSAAEVPREQMILAALGPRALRLAADRTVGSHPYFTTPRHTAMAREIVGDQAVLAVCQTVVVDSDRDRGRGLARAFAARYLGLVNYRNSLLREGWAREDLDDGGSAALIDEVVLTGDAELVASGIRAHIEAGADNVNIQVLGDDPKTSYRVLAGELLG